MFETQKSDKTGFGETGLTAKQHVNLNPSPILGLANAPIVET